MKEQNRKFLEKWNDVEYVTQLRNDNRVYPVAAQIAARMAVEDRPEFVALICKEGHEQRPGLILLEQIPSKEKPEYSLCRYLVEN